MYRRVGGLPSEDDEDEDEDDEVEESSELVPDVDAELGEDPDSDPDSDSDSDSLRSSVMDLSKRARRCDPDETANNIEKSMNRKVTLMIFMVCVEYMM